jgi:hypothetical protein
MQTPPARFRHPIDSPDPLAAHYYRRFMRKAAGGPVRKQAETLATALWQGDPLMDAWVAKAREIGAGAEALFERALHCGPVAVSDGPAELIALIDRTMTVPLWVDAAQLELGARTARRAGPIAGIVLSGFSLMGGYRSSAVVKPLMMTGKLRYDASRRLTDTGRFVVAITEPDALLPPGEGFRACLRIRYLHARIRSHLSRSPEWKPEEWGLPINQADMLGTNLLFSLGFLLGARTLGMSFARDEAESVIHLWRYVGYLLGIDEPLLPASVREAERAMYLVGASQPSADDDSVELANALHREPLERAHTDRERRFAHVEMAIRTSLSRVLLGEDVANELHLPKSPLGFAARGIVPVVALLERLRKTAPFGNSIAYRLGARWIKSSVETRAVNGHA